MTEANRNQKPAEELSTPVKNTAESNPRSAILPKVLTLLVVLGLFGLCLWKFDDQLSLAKLAEREAEFRAYQAAHPVLVFGAAFLAYVVVAGLSLPGAAGMTLLLGWLFGFWRGVLVVSFASTAGASVAFLLSRYLMRDAIQSKFGERLAKFNEALRKEGAFYLFTLRLIPAVPFFVINVVMGLTPMRLATYWWVSQIGMLPGTAAYVYAGASVPNLKTLAERGMGGIVSPQLLTAFIILGLLPIAIKKIMGLAQKPQIENSVESTHSNSLVPDSPVRNA